MDTTSAGHAHRRMRNAVIRLCSIQATLYMGPQDKLDVLREELPLPHDDLNAPGCHPTGVERSSSHSTNEGNCDG